MTGQFKEMTDEEIRKEAFDRVWDKHGKLPEKLMDFWMSEEKRDIRIRENRKRAEWFFNEMSPSYSRDDSTYDRCKRVLEAYNALSGGLYYHHYDLFIKVLRMNGFDDYADKMENIPAELESEYEKDNWLENKTRLFASNISTKMMLTKQWQKENLKFAFSKEGIAGTVLGVLVMSLSLYTSEIFLIIGIIIWIIGLSWHSLTHGGQD